MSDYSEWVSLGEAAEILGVHPTTVRTWADSGELPSQRTPGGHRRFRRGDLSGWLARQQGANSEPSPREAQLMLQNALGRARLEVGGGQLGGKEWYDRLDDSARQQHRDLGRRLLEMMTRYLADPDAGDDVMEEVSEIGEMYATLSLDHGLPLVESVRAFLFFRDLLTQSVIQLAELLSLRTPLDWADRLQQVNHITDELLLSLISTYNE